MRVSVAPSDTDLRGYIRGERRWIGIGDAKSKETRYARIEIGKMERDGEAQLAAVENTGVFTFSLLFARSVAGRF